MPWQTEQRLTRRQVVQGLKAATLGAVGGGLVGLFGGYSLGKEEGFRQGAARFEPRVDPGVHNERVMHSEESYVLPAGGYESTRLAFEKKTLLRADVTADGYVDVLTMDPRGFAFYREGNAAFEYIERASALDTTTAVVHQVLRPGEYVLVLDNSRLARAAGESEVHATVELEGYQRHLEYG